MQEEQWGTHIIQATKRQLKAWADDIVSQRRVFNSVGLQEFVHGCTQMWDSKIRICKQHPSLEWAKNL